MRKLRRFIQEVQRRKVYRYVIGYLAGSITIIEFLDVSSTRFNISDETIELLYIISAGILPLVIILPWILNRKQHKHEFEESTDIPGANQSYLVSNNNLPVQLTSFIGRSAEMQDIKGLISEYRLVTIIGPGGFGKTRLSCETAGNIKDDFPDGVWLADLTPISLEDMVAKEVASVLSIPESPGQDVLKLLIKRIKDKILLIILDNCEHLIAASANLVTSLLQQVPGLKILATSREALNITGEKIWKIPALTLQDDSSSISLSSARKSEAILLFENRAKLKDPDFTLDDDNVDQVSSICSKLDGIPLAVELVASRTRHLPVHQILENITDSIQLISSKEKNQSDRHHTLSSTIEWSYRLMSEKEKILFQRLAVFRGVIESNAVIEVCCRDSISEQDLFELLSSLVDKSFIRKDENSTSGLCYKMYETLRQYAYKQLQDSGEEKKLHEHQLLYYLDLASSSFEEQYDDQQKWISLLSEEHDNFIAVLEWSYTNDQDSFILLVASLSWYWIWGTQFQTGQHFLKLALSQERKESPSTAKLLQSAGTAMFFSGNPEKSIEYTKESIKIWKKLGKPTEEVMATSGLGLVCSSLGDAEYGLKYSEEALDLARKLENPAIINFCRMAIGQAYVCLNRLDELLPMALEMVNDSKEYNQISVLRLGYHYLADIELLNGKYRDAEKKYVDALKVANEIGNILFCGIELTGVAMSVSGQHRIAKAIRINSAATAQSKKIGYMDPAEMQLNFWVALTDKYIRNVKKKLGPGLLEKYTTEGENMSLDDLIAYAIDINKD